MRGMRIAILSVFLMFLWPTPAAEAAPGDAPEGSAVQDDDDSAAGPPPEPTPEPTPSLPPAANERLSTARILVERLGRLDGEIALLTDQRNREFDAEERVVLNMELKVLTEQQTQSRDDLQRLVTGLDMTWLSEPPDDEFALEDEIGQLLSPIVQELKAATARPRKIEQLRILVAHYEERVPRLDEALDDLDTLASEAVSPDVGVAIQELRRSLAEQRKLLEEQLSIARHELTLLESQKKSLVESGADVARIFFRNRGRNLVMALLALVFVFGFIRTTHRGLKHFFGPDTDDQATIWHRIADLIGYLMAVAGGVAGLLLVLAGLAIRRRRS